MERWYHLPTGCTLRVIDQTGRALQRQLGTFLLAHARPLARTELADFELALCPRSTAEVGASRAARRFAYDTGDSGPAVCWCDAAGALTFRDDVRGVCTRWSASRCAVEIASERAASGNLVQEAYAAVRWMLCRRVFERGGMLLHASAFAWGERGVVVVGEKAAGKTTLATASLALGAAYVASDRTFIWPDASAPRAAGWISTYRVDPVAIALALPPAAHARLSEYVTLHATTPGFTYASKVRLPPMDLLSMLGAAAAPEVNLSVIGELRGRAGKLAIRSLSPSERARVLARHRVPYALPAPVGTPTRAPRTPPALSDVEFVSIEGQASPSDLAQRLRELASHIQA